MKTAKAQYRAAGHVRPEGHKDLTRDEPIRDLPLPELLRVSMSQHLGAPAEPCVNRGDTVLRGQLIGKPTGFVSAAVHAPTSGTVRDVAQAPTPIGALATAVEIEPDGNDAWAPDIETQRSSRESPRSRIAAHPASHKEDIIGIVADAGIVGMGGAGFPTHVKLSPPPDRPIDTLIINGAECEPYLTADHRLMVEQADQIWAGARLIQGVLGAASLRVAIEENKPEAVAAMERAGREGEGSDGAVVVLKTAYPQGAEKQQIFAITGREVPSGGLPMDVGTVDINVATTMAVWDAVVNARPLTERITTVTGPPVTRPNNVRARVGTPFSKLIEFCGEISGSAAKVIAGGPMMGLAQHSLDVATTKTTSGLLVLSADALSDYTSMPCIGCGRCVEACPSRLMPCELSQMLEAEDYEAAERYRVMDCIECGGCAYSCPAHRPLVQHMKQGKAWVTAKLRAEKG